MGDPGEDPPLFLDQTEAQRPKKIFFSRPPPTPPPLSQGLDDGFPPLPPSPPYLKVSIHHCKFNIFCFWLVLLYFPFKDEADEEIEEDDNYLDLAGMKQQSQMNVNNIW